MSIARTAIISVLLISIYSVVWTQDAIESSGVNGGLVVHLDTNSTSTESSQRTENYSSH